MVKFDATWFEKTDRNGIQVGLWASRADEKHVNCDLCHVQLKFEKQGFQAIMQHSQKPSHRTMSTAKFDKNQPHFFAGASSKTSSGPSAAPQKDMQIGSYVDLQRSAEAMWLFKVAEEDYSFRYFPVILKAEVYRTLPREAPRNTPNWQNNSFV